MSKTVHLSLTGRQRDETGADLITKTAATAEYYEKNGSIYILYQESAEDTDPHQQSHINSHPKSDKDTGTSQQFSAGISTYHASDKDMGTYHKPGAAVGAVIKSRMKLKDGILELTKTGAVSTRMIFEADREYLTDYATPWGRLKLGILTHAVNCSTQDGKMIIQVQYSLTSEGRLISECEMEILLADL